MLEPIDSGKEASGNCCVQMPVDALKEIVKWIEEEEKLKEQCVEYIEIGDTIKIEGKTYKCITKLPCDDCSFKGITETCLAMACAAGERPDHTDVIFKQVEE